LKAGETLTDLPRTAAVVTPRDLPLGLADLPLRVDAWVSGLRMDAAPQDGDVLLRLLEIGFLPGERVRVVARAFPAGDPLAVRVGRTTFALRRREAALVQVSTRAPVVEVPA
jgi:ferrous iron transport protein A